MAELFHNETPQKIYWDRRHFNTFDEYTEALKGTKTVYVGNLSFFTTETQIKELFSKVGPVKRVLMGLDRFKKTPCGFCFVEYYSHSEALDSINFVDGTSLDDRIIRVDIDFGWAPGRQYGRGSSGGQVRDERRWTYDPARGGLGKIAERQAEMDAKYGPRRSDYRYGSKRRYEEDRESSEERRRRKNAKAEADDSIEKLISDAEQSDSSSSEEEKEEQQNSDEKESTDKQAPSIEVGLSLTEMPLRSQDDTKEVAPEEEQNGS